ncbi:AAA family ATPase [Streptomyces sp. NPDC057253]|uniref:helix-turn-helix transcriptional regulator n=1 Tax=Streptomyces sp. NPDC057253 TaxID=3346069 RepID=UPI0036357130
MARRGARAGLLGRASECKILDDLVAGARAGRSGVLVLRGEPGIGKTELLSHLLARATGCRTIRAAGVQSEMELSYAGLHQLCAPLLGGLDQLPEPQRDALGTAFGLRVGAAPDRFLVGLATLSLLADAGGDQPLVCVVDDAQWLDRASALTLEFVARRLLAESVVLVFAVRDTGAEHALGNLPELSVTGLTERDSWTLLDSVVTGPLDERVRERIVAESRGNPLALLELPRGLSPAEMAGGFERPDAWPLSSQLEQEFLRRIQALPVETRSLLLIAAAEPLGDVTLLRRVAEHLGIDADAAVSHEGASDLITLGTRVRFRHPLVRSAAYRAASPSERREVHKALADATDARLDPDRRSWHLADAAAGPDETVAAELERSAGRALARGGIAAAAAFLQRATALTEDPARRTQRAMAAAQTKLQTGAFEQAATLLGTAAAGPVDELSRARIEVLHAGLAFAQNRGGEAPSLLLAAARRFGRLDDVGLARGTYLDAIAAAIFAGRLARGPGLLEVGEAAREAPQARRPEVSDVVLDALAVRLTDGLPAAAPMMERALKALSDERLPPEVQLRRLWLASVIAADLWDDERWLAASTRHVTITREAGALSALPDALDSRTYLHLIAGELAAAESLIEETAAVCAATGNTSPGRVGPLGLAVWRGRESEARTLIETNLGEAVPRGQGATVTVTRWYEAVLCNGLGQYAQALTAAREAAAEHREFASSRWGLAELIEAAVRSGSPESATDALERLSEATRASGTDWALGVEARSRALLSEGDAAERLYREAIERLERTRVRMEVARAHLLYGEWLRRENRRADARAQLDVAHGMFSRFGAEAFAARARGELQATGAKVRSHTIARPTGLTPQEAQIARLAGKGLTNPEIGAQLFISRHTVEWHLRKVFSKLSISSRREIRAIQFEDEATSA